MLSPLLPLGFTPEAPVAYEANNFSRNHIKQTRCSIDCKNDIIHPLLSALYFPQTEEQSGGENLYPREILFHGDGVLSMLISTCVGFFPPPIKQLCIYVHAQEHLHYRGFCSGIQVSILVCQRRRGRQSMRQLHQSAKSVWKSLSHTQAELMNMRLRVCVLERGWLVAT